MEFFTQFSMTDRESCEKAIRNGGIAAVVSASVTTLFGVAGIFTSSANQALANLLDPWILVDAVLLFVLAGFVFRKSRIAASLLLAHFVVGKLIMWSGSTNFFSFLIFLYYLTAVRATFQWHGEYFEPQAQGDTSLFQGTL